MKLWQYIQGPRKGKEAHRIEREAMKDPFLADALEGYEKTPGNHQREVNKLQKEVDRMQKRITNKATGKRTNHWKGWGIAASLILVAGLGTWLVLDGTLPIKDLYTSNRQAETTPPPASPAPQPQSATTDTTSIALEQEPIPEQSPIAQAKQEVKEAQPEQKVTVEAITEDISTTEVITEQKIAKAPEASAPAVQETAAPAPAMARTAESTPEATDTDSSTPRPVDGLSAYHEYIQRNLRRPTDDECRNVKGKVVVVFKIGQSGRPYNIRVTEGLCSSINKEAIRLIINGPDWKKGTTSDEARLTIDF